MGEMPLANDFLGDTDRHGRTAPLTLVMCDECSVIQIREILPPEELYANFLWVSGTSETARRYAVSFARTVAERTAGGAGRRLVEVGSNDGLLLEACRTEGFEVLGVDPSAVADEASARGLPTIRALFGVELAQRIRSERGPADVIVARHAVSHAAEPLDFFQGVRELLAPEGRCFIETPYALFLQEELQYDTIFHEHVCYWTITALSAVLRRFELNITDVRFVAMNGGSFVVEVGHAAAGPSGDRAILELEALLRLNEPAGWEAFASRVAEQRRTLRDLLTELSHGGARVAAYGAAAKFMTLLNYCGITRDLVSAVGDANPRKQGLFCPGVRIPVVSPEELIAGGPDHILIGAWNFKDEIIRVLREKFGYTGRFIVPLPVPTLV